VAAATEAATVLDAGLDALLETGDLLVGLFLGELTGGDLLVDLLGLLLDEEVDQGVNVVAGDLGRLPRRPSRSPASSSTVSSAASGSTRSGSTSWAPAMPAAPKVTATAPRVPAPM